MFESIDRLSQRFGIGAIQLCRDDLKAIHFNRLIGEVSALPACEL